VNLLHDSKTVNLLGTDVSAMGMEEVLDLCEDHISIRASLLLGVVNVAKIVNCRRNTALRESLDEADIILADGLPLVWFSKLIGNPLPERVAGIDIMYRLLERASQKSYRVYFLGAKQKIVKKVVEIVKVDYPGVRIAGYRDGYFDESEEKDVAENIKNSLADILFVAMSPPKKENFLSRWWRQMNVPVCHGVGGSFDVVAGVTKRAPVWMQNCGLEWLYRLLQEPGRMWKRYLVTNSIFIFLSISEIMRARFCALAGKFHKRTRVKP
jgi:N-acetylglucosaminyldiphosphoundecaprenol N-acetyl-beta-D-mannosaminyltransferase